jgi:hypothetical protein
VNPPRIQTHWNARRAEVTHKVTKAGTSAFLLLNNAELLALRDLIDSAIEARHASAP